MCLQKGADTGKSEREDSVPNHEGSEDEDGSEYSVDLDAIGDSKRIVSN